MAIPPMVLGAPRLPEIGHLKLGGKDEKERTSSSGTKWHAPVKFDHWVITTRRRDGVNLSEDEDLMAALSSYRGNTPEAPTRIPIFLPYNEPDLNFYTGLALYAGRKRICWNDQGGEAAIRVIDDRKQPCAPREVRCPCPLLQHSPQGPAKCKWHGTLRVMVRLPGASMGGFFTFRTTSKHSIKNIIGGMARFAHETGGILAGLPLELVCDKQTLKTPDEKDMSAMIVRLDYPGDPEQFLAETVEVRKRWIERRQVLGQIGVQEKRLLLTFQGTDEDDNADDINGEFSPETVNMTAKEAVATEPSPPAKGQASETKVTGKGRKRKEEAPVVDADFSVTHPSDPRGVTPPDDLPAEQEPETPEEEAPADRDGPPPAQERPESAPRRAPKPAAPPPQEPPPSEDFDSVFG